MKLSELSIELLGHHLAADGIYLHTGPFVSRIQTHIPSVIKNLYKLYKANELSLEPVFSDFHIRLDAARGLRRWFKPQVFFYLDEKIPFKPLPYDQAYPMLEWGMNWCISNHAHQYLILHAAVVEKNKHAIVMPARPGAGKSTLTAGLVSRGWRLLSDELALICPETQELVGLSRPVNLKNESISIIKQFAPEVLFSDEIKDTNKGTVSLMQAPAKSVERAGERAKISCFVIPEYVSEHATQLDRLNKAEMFMHIADNAFNYSLHGLSGYKTVARILEFADAWQLTYSELGEAINVFDKMVEHG